MVDKIAAESQRGAETTLDMPTTYDPAKVEATWYDFWEGQGLFRADSRKSPDGGPKGRPDGGAGDRREDGSEDRSGEPFAVVIPPPNVTGSLHMGHALNSTLQDVLVRWRRMQGH